MNPHEPNEQATAGALRADAERHTGWVFFLLSAGSITAAFGVVTLLGWVLGWPLLTSFGAGRIPMAPSTAVLFLLYGAAIGLRARPLLSRRTFRISTTLGGLGTLLALLLFTLSSRGLHWSVEHIALPITGTVGVFPQGYMSPLTAFCFLLAGLSFLASLAQVAIPLWRTTLAWGAAGVLSGLCLILLLAYLYGTPLLYGGTLIPPALNTVLAFMVLSLSLLTLAGQSAGQFRRASGDNSRTGVALVLIFLLLAAGIITTGWLFYRSFAQRDRVQMEHQLSAIAELKVAELTQWRQERLGDGAILFQNSALTALVRRFFDKPEDVDAQRQLKVWLGKYEQYPQYDRVLLLDTLGTERLTASAKPEPVTAHLAQDVAAVLRSGRVMLLDFHRGAPGRPIHLSVLVPILDEADANRPLGAFMLRINPERYLYPFIKRWPTPSLTAETLLVRREGNEAVFLNELRFQTNTALTVRSSLAKTNLLAVKAALGLTGIVEGIDYRGVPVVGDVRAIPDSPWFMVTRMDSAEVYGPLHERRWMALVLIAVLLFGTGAGLGMVWRQQRARFYREQYEMSEESRASELRYRRLFESAKDGILILDAETGMIVEANPFLTQLLGLTHEDFLGKKVWELGFFKDIAANAAKFAELQAKDYVRYEDLPLETADGRKIEVEFVSNVYLVNQRRVIQCNIRDITARKRTERLAKDVLAALNRPNNTKNIIRDILAMIKTQTGIEAVGIRLKAGEEFPYYQTHGFPDDFARLKNQLCAHNAAGQILRDGQGHPVLACMCGNVICGRTDATLPYFTAGGSFWINSATDLLAGTTAAERLAHTLNRCHGAGYESLAMIPLRAGTETIGLLQLLDHRRNQFTTELITVLEWLGASVGVALTRMRAEDAVRASAQHIRLLLDSTAEGLYGVDVLGNCVFVNRACLQMLGYAKEEDLLGRHIHEVIHHTRPNGTPYPAEECRMYTAMRRNVGAHVDDEVFWRRDGTSFPVECWSYPIFSEGLITGAVATFFDITERKQVEKNLGLFRTLVDQSTDAFEVVDPETGRFLDVNEKGCRDLGYSREEFLKLRVSDIDPMVNPTGFTGIMEELQQTGAMTWKGIHRRKDGSTFPVEVNLKYVRLDRPYMIAVVRDITEQQRAAEAQARLAMAVEQAAEAISITDTNGTIIYINPASAKISGYTRAEVYGHTPRLLKSGKQDAEFYRKMWLTLTAGQTWRGHLINKRKDGTLYEEEATVSPVFDAAGKIINYVAVKRDVTREVALETQNRQNAKMEAVGQLAGGVAHDFNNRLQVIMGCVEMVLSDLPPEHPARPDLLDVLDAARRSADLTRQLLAFSRQQAISPVLLDLNAALSGSLKMLSRVIGENIQLRFVPQPDLGRVFMDSSQLDQILINLAVNARDAIAGAGSITIEATNRTLEETDCADKPDFVAPGDYVALSFRDDGPGMTPEIQARIFEPFFTTKEEGKGTGLGLATVYGIVKQNKGAIGVQSVPGAGTTFTILLPRSSEAALAADEETKERMPTGTETILVAEDDGPILHLVERTLAQQGYKVLTAILPRLALEVCAQYPEPIHLLLSDVIMPEMSGKALAEQVRKLRPGLRVLHMSGYSATIMEQHGQIPAGLHVLQKPFTAMALAQRVRAVLDAPPPARGA